MPEDKYIPYTPTLHMCKNTISSNVDFAYLLKSRSPGTSSSLEKSMIFSSGCGFWVLFEAPFPGPFPLDEPGIGLPDGVCGGVRCMLGGRVVNFEQKLK